MKVAFQGEIGAYSEEAIIQRYGDAVETLPRPYLRDVFDAVEEGKADLGLVPIENTIEGSIVRSYDLLNERGIVATGEVILRVVHCLIANPSVTLDQIREVYSHPQALGQCREYLESRGLKAVSAYDTAGSVKMIKEQELRYSAAIASQRSAEVYGMTILDNNIETHHENYTRFLLIGHEEQQPTGHDKTSIAFIVVHRPGSLHQALKPFADYGINLTKVESRPLIGRPWEYVFFIDVLGHKEDANMRNALIEIQERSDNVKILGSYPRAD